MELNEYQAAMVKTWESDKTPEEELVFSCVGMAEEAGECMGKVKRWMRGEGFDREGYLKELGDVLAYLAIAANSMDIELEGLLFGKQTVYSVLSNTAQLFDEVNDFLQIYIATEEIKESEKDGDSEMVGDVLEIIVDCAYSTEVKGSLEEVMELNLKKLADRKARNGNLRGSGNNR